MQTVAILTPIYATPENRRLELFDPTVRSVIRQQAPAFKILYCVVDDGSTVNVEGFLRDYKDTRIRYLRRQRSPTDLKTASNALNLGMEHVIDRSRDLLTAVEAGDLYALTFLHSDDILSPDSIAGRVAGLKGGFAYTDMKFFNGDGVIVNERKGPYVGENMFANTNFFRFNHHTLMWDIRFLSHLRNYARERFNQPGVFDPRLFCGEDADVSMSSFEAALDGGFPIAYAPFVSLYYRHHPGSISGHITRKESKQQLSMVMEKHPAAVSTKSNEEYVERLLADLPWSLLTFMPDKAKKRLRPIRDLVKGLVANKDLNDVRYLEEMLSGATQ